VPLAVLVDGDTASSAEVVAGALKDNQRAVIVGQPTYGKASIQYVFPLENAPGGLRLTVAKFSTPSRVPLSGRGLMPDVPVAEADPEAALKAAEEVLRGAMMMLR
jgi:carboxyl-terminal processing protease